VELLALADPDADLVVAAAWLHDVGYAPRLRRSGFHPLDGAAYLWVSGWPADLCALVARHSGAEFVAEVQGLSAQLADFAVPDPALLDVLTYADQTIGPGGVAMQVEDRIADMLRRHGQDSPNARAPPRRGPHLLAVAQRIRARLSETD
jgi:hypothetical protein